MMTEHDKKLIEEAVRLAKKRDGWIYIDENEADTEEGRQELHNIASFAYHRDEYRAGLL